MRKPNARLPEEAIRAYKTMLTFVLDQRPSGTRQRLADALGKHRSFVTQITSPAYPTPIPARHLATIFAVCHFSSAERENFLTTYGKAHPGKESLGGVRKTRHLSLIVPVFSDDKQNAAFDSAVNDFIQRLASIVCKAGG